MPCWCSHTASGVPTSALWRAFTKLSAASKGVRPSSGRTRPLDAEKGLSGVSGPSTCSTRTIGMLRSAQPCTSRLTAERKGRASASFQ